MAVSLILPFTRSHVQQPIFAFVDEHGDPQLDTGKEGVSSHFVVAAITVEPAEFNELYAHVDTIRSRHFQTGEIKSSKVGGNWARRDRVLGDLLALSFRFHLLVIHKDRIRADSGLRYKRSFLKYIHGALYQRLYAAIPDLRVIADEHGSREFMLGFQDYVRRRHIPDLFKDAEIRFEKSKAQPLIQLADFLAGSVGHSLRAGSEVPVDHLLRRFGRKLTTFVEWPPLARPFYSSAADSDRALDDLVREYGLNRAASFINSNEDTEDFAVRCQVEVLRDLHFHCQFISERDYVSTRRLRDVILSTTGRSVGEHFFRTKVIARLRDEGVLVASSPAGYKIPVSAADMHRFVEQADQMIGPLLTRLNAARDALATASNGRLDILDRPEHQHLRRRAT